MRRVFVVKSCSDAYVAKLTKDKPKVSFVTDGAKDQALQDKAKALETFCDGQMYELDFYRLYPTLALDTCIFKNGILKFYVGLVDGEKRIRCERVLPTEILVDDAEGIYGRPQNMYQEKYVDRLVALAKWGDTPEKKAAILRLTPQVQASADGYNSTADHIRVREAWHLPPPDGDGKGGWWCVVINGMVLDEGPWKRRDFPFAVLRRADPLSGWWGTALADDLCGIQREITRILYAIQRHFHLLGSSKVVVPLGYNKNKIDNDIDILEANLQDGKPYVLCPQNLVAPEMYAHLDRLYGKAYELSGVNQMSAQSQIPQQVESGKAIQALADVESDRFMTSFRLAEHFVIDVTKQILTLAEEISETNKDFGVQAFSSAGMKRVVFQKNWLRKEEYVLKMYPTNLLAKDPPARMGQVEKMANSGWIQPDDAMRLLDFPDLQASQSTRFANYNATKRIIENIQLGLDFIGPDPLMNLNESIGMVRSAYQETIGKNGVDPDVASNLRKWCVQAQQMLTPPPKPAAPTPANMQGVQAAQAMQAAAAAQQTNGAPAAAPPQNPAPPMQ